MKVNVFVLILSAVLLTTVCIGVGCVQKEKQSSDSAEVTQDNEAEKAQVQSADEQSVEKPDIDYLVIVDRDHPLPEGWEEKISLAYNLNSVGDDVYAETVTYDAYKKMKEALEREGIHVELDSGFRSVNAQQKIVDEFTEKYGENYARTYAAVPGCSEHHTGLALDLYLIVDGETVYENEDLMKHPEVWEKIHAKLPDYGFILRYTEGNDLGYPYEPWHIRYVGKEAAEEICEKGITLEKYMESHSGESEDSDE